MSGKVLTDPKDVYIVSERKIPTGFPGAEKLAGKPVAEEHVRVLRVAGFTVFNLAAAHERAQEKREAEARNTIAEILKAKGQGFPQLEVATAG